MSKTHGKSLSPRDELRQLIRDLLEAINTAHFSNRYGWVFQEILDGAFFFGSFSRWRTFFEVTYEAYLADSVFALYKMYETRNDTSNFHELCSLAERSGVIDPGVTQDARAAIKTLKPLWVKISILRNVTYGHMKKDANADIAHLRAAISSAEIGDLVCGSLSLLNLFAVALNKRRFRLEPTPERDLKLMLDVLEANSPQFKT